MKIDKTLIQINQVEANKKLGYTIPYEVFEYGASFKIQESSIALVYENDKLINTISIGNITKQDITPKQKIVFYQFEDCLQQVCWKMPKAPFINTELKIRITGNIHFNVIDPAQIFEKYGTDATHQHVQNHISVHIINILTKEVMNCHYLHPQDIVIKDSVVEEKISKVLDRFGIMVVFNNFMIESYD
ncbi:MAG: hypothetical protein RLZZ175_2533 [Bacteroidota bacterium]|jgi:hypothetical protein